MCINADSKRRDRLDMFAGQHIRDFAKKGDPQKVLKLERSFIEFCKVECGWSSHEIHDLESMKNALREFMKKTPGSHEFIQIH